MIAPAEVGVDVYQAIEGTLRLQVRKMQSYDWWQAGIQSGTIPTEWEVLKYGREHALAWWLEGVEVPQAVTLGVKAMYQLAYGDSRDTIRRSGGGCHSATSATEIEVTQTVTSDYDMIDMVARSNLSDSQKRMVVWYMYGWSRTEAIAAEGLPLRTGQRHLAAAFNQLKGELYASQI